MHNNLFYYLSVLTLVSGSVTSVFLVHTALLLLAYWLDNVNTTPKKTTDKRSRQVHGR